MEYVPPKMQFYYPASKRKTPDAQAQVDFAKRARLSIEHAQHNAKVEALRVAKAARKANV